MKRENECTSAHGRKGRNAFAVLADRRVGGGGRGRASKEKGGNRAKGKTTRLGTRCRSGTRFLFGTAYLVATKLNNRDITAASARSCTGSSFSTVGIERDPKTSGIFVLEKHDDL